MQAGAVAQTRNIWIKCSQLSKLLAQLKTVKMLRNGGRRCHALSLKHIYMAHLAYQIFIDDYIWSVKFKTINQTYLFRT